MNILTIVAEMEQGLVSPINIVGYRNHIASCLYHLHIEYGQVKSQAALWLTANRDKFKSQAECERAWEAGTRGQRQIALKHEIEALGHIQESLATNWFLLNREAKNQM